MLKGLSKTETTEKIPRLLRLVALEEYGKKKMGKFSGGMIQWKLAAGLLSAFLITSLQIVVYYSLYSTNDIGMFLKSGINSFMGRAYWYDFSFLQLIIITIIQTYVLAKALALLTMLVSHMYKNYITIIGILLPVFVLICLLVVNGDLLGEAFLISHSQFLVAFLYLLIICLPVVGIIWRWKREKKKDIV